MSDGNKERFFPEFDFPTRQDWKEASIKALKGADFDRKILKNTYEGITLKGIYTKEDWDNAPHISNQYPGYYPFSRGNEPTGSLKQAWLLAQEIPYLLPRDFNKAAIRDIEMGLEMLYVHVNSSSGRSGVILSDMSDFETAFEGIDLAKTAIMFEAGTNAYAVASIFSAYLNKHKISKDKVSVFFGLDPIGDFARNGSINTEFSIYFDQVAELTAFVSKYMPLSKSIKMNGNIFHNAGSNKVQEIAYAMATGVDYIRRLGKRGMKLSSIARRIYLSISAGSNYFMEIAKIRAARLVWSKIIREFGGNEDDQKLHIHVNTSARDRSKFDPYVNMLRNTSQAFSAVLGGCDSLMTGFFDEVWGLPSDFSRRMSRNTQHVLREEAHITDTIDPAGGSWYIESVTYELAEKIWEEFRLVEQQGGALEALKNNFLQDRINENFAARIKNLSTRKDVILGTNKYPNLNEKPIDSVIHYFDEDLSDFNRDANARYIKRDAEILRKELSLIENPSSERFENTQKAATSGANVSEITKSIIEPDESQLKITPITMQRSGAMFEKLRDAANNYKSQYGELPTLGLLCFGALKVYKARADFAADFFAVGGFLYRIADGNFTSEDAIEKTRDCNPKAIVICSSDETYEEILPQFVPEFKKLHPDCKVILAGYPTEKIEEYKSAGIDEFIHIKADIYDQNVKLQSVFGVR